MKLIYKIFTSKISLILFAVLFLNWPVNESFAQGSGEKKIKIIKGIFQNCTINTFRNKKVISTIARNKYASIPLNDDECKILALSDDIFAIAFNIYLSDNEKDYENMIMADLFNFIDVKKGDPLEQLQKNERLIQLILFDMEKGSFIAKANTFPIENLSWLPTGMGDFAQYESISTLDPINSSSCSFYLKLSECPDCSDIYYFFKFADPEIKSSEKISGCFENIREKEKEILADQITNCYEVDYNNEKPEIKTKKVLVW